MDSEIQITSQYPVGAYGLYDLYSGCYLGKEVWCKKLFYGDPQGKAMMVRILLSLFAPRPNRVYFRGSGGRSTSGVSCGRRIKNDAERGVLRLGSCHFTAFTYPTKALRESSQIYNHTQPETRIQVSCKCEARAWDPPRSTAIWCRTGPNQNGEATLARRPGFSLTAFTDQGDRAGPSSSSYHGTSNIPWGPQLRTRFIVGVPQALAYDLQTSVVVDEDWNPLLQDFRLSKVTLRVELVQSCC